MENVRINIRKDIRFNQDGYCMYKCNVSFLLKGMKCKTEFVFRSRLNDDAKEIAKVAITELRDFVGEDVKAIVNVTMTFE